MRPLDRIRRAIRRESRRIALPRCRFGPVSAAATIIRADVKNLKSRGKKTYFLSRVTSDPMRTVINPSGYAVPHHEWYPRDWAHSFHLPTRSSPL